MLDGALTSVWSANTRYFRWVARAIVILISIVGLNMGGCDTLIGDPVVEVIGEVTIDRKALTDAYVVFIPVKFRTDEGRIIPMAFGKTNKTGRFELMMADQKGVFLGKYKVLIFKSDTVELREQRGRLANGIGSGSVGNGGSFPVLVEESVAAKRSVAELLGEPLETLDFGATVPARYNLESELFYEVKIPSAIVYPKFELNSD